MAAAGTLLRLLVIFLGISHHLLCLNAAPVTRIGRLVHGDQVLSRSDDTRMVAKEENWEEDVVDRRMTVEVNDYPGSGANNRHTPRAQFGRCTDC